MTGKVSDMGNSSLKIQALPAGKILRSIQRTFYKLLIARIVYHPVQKGPDVLIIMSQCRPPTHHPSFMQLEDVWLYHLVWARMQPRNTSLSSSTSTPKALEKCHILSFSSICFLHNPPAIGLQMSSHGDTPLEND